MSLEIWIAFTVAAMNPKSIALFYFCRSTSQYGEAFNRSSPVQSLRWSLLIAAGIFTTTIKRAS